MISGLRVIELATLWAAPGVGALLSDYGAEVVKVEDLAGDPLRDVSDSRTHLPLWALAGRGKRTIALALRTPDGQQKLRTLLARADVIVLNQSDDVLAKWGLSLATLSDEHPDAVICVISAYGSADPRTGNGTSIEAASGMMGASRDPAFSPILLGDYVTTMAATVAVLAALHARASGAGGRVIEVNMFDAALAACLPDINRTRHGDAPPVRAVLPTADGRHIALSATSAAQRGRLAELVEADWRSASPEEMTDDVRRWVAAHAHQDALTQFARHRVPAELVVHAHEAATRRRHEHPSSVVTIHDERFGEVLLPVPTGVDRAEYRAALGRALGADTDNILAEWDAAPPNS